MRLPRRFRPDTKGPLVRYVEEMKRIDPKVAREILLAVKQVAASPAGRILFALLEEATIEGQDPTISSRALRAQAAQRLIPLDLQRLASDESDPLLREADTGSA